MSGRRSNGSQAAAVVSYDVAHSVPWDWRVGAYTWTKGISAGVYLVAALLLLFGELEADDGMWRWFTPIIGIVFLALTAAVLIWDLEHPSRFYFIFTRPQWRSWLVRGGVLITVYGLCLAAQLVASVVDAPALSRSVIVVGLPFAGLTAVYTAFLFAQAKARDLWQSPLLAPHLVAQAVLAGASVIALGDAASSTNIEAVRWILLGAATCHLAMVACELLLPHRTMHARTASVNLTHGPIGRFFWAGMALTAVGLGAPIAVVPAAIATLVGLGVFEHAYVQAGQSAPLA